MLDAQPTRTPSRPVDDAPARRPSVLLLALPGIALATALLLPFLGKAFTIDDTLFLRQAEHALVDWRHPTAFVIAWLRRPERLSQIMPSGPVMAWLLALPVHLGAREWMCHLVEWPLAGAAIAATVGIARRLDARPAEARLAGLLVAAMPTVIGMMNTVMPDVAAMALAAIGMERLLALGSAQRRGDRVAAGIAAALAFGLGALARSHVALVAMVGTAWLLDGALPTQGRWRALLDGHQRPRALSRLVPLGLPLLGAGAIALGGTLLTRDPANATGVGGAMAGFASYRSLDRNLVAFAAHFTLAVPLAPLWTAARGRSLPWWVALPSLPLGALLLWSAGDLASCFWLLPLVAWGAVVLVDLFLDGARRRDRVQLFLAAWLVASLPVAIYLMLPPKYLLVSAPAYALLALRALARMSDARRRVMAALTVAGGVILGLLVVTSDAASADLARRATDEIVHPRLARGERVWFAGHWALQWYAAEAGARCLALDGETPAPGDVVVSSTLAYGTRELARLPHRHLEQALEGPPRRGSAMSHSTCAGFFSNGFGYCPWVPGTPERDAYEVWRVE